MRRVTKNFVGAIGGIQVFHQLNHSGVDVGKVSNGSLICRIGQDIDFREISSGNHNCKGKGCSCMLGQEIHCIRTKFRIEGRLFIEYMELLLIIFEIARTMSSLWDRPLQQP